MTPEEERIFDQIIDKAFSVLQLLIVSILLNAVLGIALLVETGHG